MRPADPIVQDTGPASPAGHQLVSLANGTWAIHAAAEDEVFHPVVGPAREADSLYIAQLRLRERLAAGSDEFVVWDVGLGGAANALALLRATRELIRPIRLISFDHTLAPLALARREAGRLAYPVGYEDRLQDLLQHRRVQFTDGLHEITWEVTVADFPAWLAAGTDAPAPDAILFDPFSPAKNPAMWSRPTFSNLFRALDPERPCALATYSRSTAIRVALLASGWFVGHGMAIGAKEESTVAANHPALVPSLLDQRWLQRAGRSHAAEPWDGAIYHQLSLSDLTRKKLHRHAQFLPAESVTGSESPAGSGSAA